MQKQLKLFGYLKTIAPKGDLVDQIAQLLSISSDSAYRRMRGQTVLSFDEFLVLAKHFKLSAEMLGMQNVNSLAFEYGGSLKSVKEFEIYFDRLTNDLKQIKSIPNSHIFYSAKDIPVFYHYLFPELAAFKLFIWMKTIFAVPEITTDKFDLNVIPHKIINKAFETGSNYCDCNTTEIWSHETLTSTLQQIEYACQVGMLDKVNFELIKMKLIELLEHVKLQAKVGTKYATEYDESLSENYQMYYNELLIMNNMFSVSVGGNLVSYFTFNALNYISTTNQHFCIENKNWLDRQIANSTLISKVSHKERNMFFNKLIERVKLLYF